MGLVCGCGRDEEALGTKRCVTATVGCDVAWRWCTSTFVLNDVPEDVVDENGGSGAKSIVVVIGGKDVVCCCCCF